jgi:CRISPR-associated protein Cas6
LPVPEIEPRVLDVVFDVEGTSLPTDNAWQLLQQIEHRLPWFGGDAVAGVHPLRSAPTDYGVVLLAQRAKLVLRAPATRLADCLALQQADLDIGGNRLQVGGGRARALRPSATLSAFRVAIAANDAHDFEREARRMLEALAVDCDLISGRRRQGRAGQREIAGFALSLIGLSPADSLRIQATGIGGDRGLGWGVFVPAKAIDAART